MSDKIDIYLSADDKYAPHLGVVICSIFENKLDDYNINIHVIDGGISDINKKKLEDLEKRYNFSIKYDKIDVERFKGFPVRGHMSLATYYRILIPDLIKSSTNKIIYLDSDIIVLGDIIKLYNVEIDNYCIAAVKDEDQESPLIKEVKQNLQIKENESYFNAGVLLINLKKWREDKVTQRAFEFIENNPEKIIIYDQDALNYLLHNQCKYIEGTYNTQLKEESFNPKDKPLILHLTSENKPWNYNYLNKYGKEQYFYYLKKTPWKHFKYSDFDIKNFFRKEIKKLKRLVKKIYRK